MLMVLIKLLNKDYTVDGDLRRNDTNVTCNVNNSSYFK